MTLTSTTLPIQFDEDQIAQNLLTKLTKREWEVILHLSRGMTSPEIATQIFVQPKSVENYRTRIGTKLKLKGRNRLARFSWKNHEALHDWYTVLISHREEERISL